MNERWQRPDVIRDRKKYTQGWRGGLPETPCGFGSKLDQTQIQRRWLPEMITKYGITDLGDIGAGDLNWVRHTQWPPELAYTAYDLVPRQPEVIAFDLVAEVPPRHQALMLLWVLNHFPENNARTAFEHIRASGCEYLFMTWDSRLWDFLDLQPLEQVQIREARKDKPSAKGHEGVFLRLIRC